VIASDVRPRRVALLRETVRASGAAHVHVVHVAASGALPFARLFDRVLVDAPCSGLGTIRRDPDIRWRRRETDLKALAVAQVELLTRAADVVASGGRLIYATCSSEPDENEQVVEAFLRARPEYGIVDMRTESSLLSALLDHRGMLRTLPHVHRLEAFFAAVLRRT
jgi:16S rRNA (cytosine967-C5)-methyltransferase